MALPSLPDPRSSVSSDLLRHRAAGRDLLASAAGLTTLQPGQGYKIFVNNTGTLLWVDVA